MPSMPFDADAVWRWLDDIHLHIILAEQFADGMNYDALRDDLRTTYVVMDVTVVPGWRRVPNRNVSDVLDDSDSGTGHGE
jgi:hypothetical protein